MKIARMFLFAAGLALSGAGVAQAQFPLNWPGNFGGGYGNGYGMSGSAYALGLVPTPPYYALNPPVYYSCPVPRSYGYSPFAYPGWMQTPEVQMLSFPQNSPAPSQPMGEELPPAKPASNVAARGQWIENPFVSNPNYGMIVNPFVTPKDAPAENALTSRDNPNAR